MKKNLSLFGLVLLLLGVTYFFQEIRSEKEYVAQEQKARLLQDDLVHLKLPAAEAVKKDGNWWEGDLLLSHNTFKQIEKKLQEIKKIKTIEGDWKNFFSHPFVFEVNNEKWTIGDMSLDKEAFYIAKGDKIYLAVIEGPSHQLTHDASEIEASKLNDLVSFLSRSLNDLKETQLFRFYPNLPMERVVVDVEGSLPFELNFKEGTTEPPPVPGIDVHHDLANKFVSLLTQVNVKSEIPYSEKLKFKKLAEVKLLKDDQTVTWELFLKDSKSADAYILDSDKKRAYLMVGGTLKVFFIQVQDYWDKKVIPPEAFVDFSKTNATFIQGSKEAVVTIINRQPLGFEVKGYKVDQAKMEFLLQFIFNLDSKDQAERVSQLSKSERQQILSEEHLRIEILGQELLLWRKAEELIVVNLTQGFKAHFNLVDENFNGKFEDVLK